MDTFWAARKSLSKTKPEPTSTATTKGPGASLTHGVLLTSFLEEAGRTQSSSESQRLCHPCFYLNPAAPSAFSILKLLLHFLIFASHPTKGAATEPTSGSAGCLFPSWRRRHGSHSHSPTSLNFNDPSMNIAWKYFLNGFVLPWQLILGVKSDFYFLFFFILFYFSWGLWVLPQLHGSLLTIVHTYFTAL